MSTPDFFRSRLDAMIDLRHPLAVLANRMPWSSIEATLTPMFERRAREGRMSAEVDLFGVTPKLAGAGVSAAGRPRLSVRLMVGLLYLPTHLLLARVFRMPRQSLALHQNVSTLP